MWRGARKFVHECFMLARVRKPSLLVRERGRERKRKGEGERRREREREREM